MFGYIYIVPDLSGWNGVFSDVRPYGTVIDMIFLTNLSNGITVLRLHTVKFGNRSLFFSNAFRTGKEKILHVRTLNAYKTGADINGRNTP